MQESIKFTELEIKPSKVSVLASYNDMKSPLWFEFDREVSVSSSQVALALSTLCGSEFNKIHFDFEVQDHVLNRIRQFTGSEVRAPHEANPGKLVVGGRHIISFSGGFDSIAAAELLNFETSLVSLDFGGWFQREAEYFRKYDPLIISTNIRREPNQRESLVRNHWLYMSVGAILTAQYLDASFHTFGTILGASFANPAKSQLLIPLEAAGLTEIPVTSGLTEVGTTRIMLTKHLNEVSDSLKSLAGVRDRKNYYKQALVTLVASDLGIASPIPPLNREWSAKIEFDNSYTTALSALYFLARGKADLIAPLFKSIPESAFEVASGLSMNFMNKANYDYYEEVPDAIYQRLLLNLNDLGFSPYTEADWNEIKVVRSFLATIF